MKKWIFLAAVAGILAFQFQNCQQVQSSDPAAQSTSMASSTDVQTAKEEVFNISTLVAIDTTSSRNPLNLRIDLASFQFKLIDESGNLSNESYCLNDNEKNELNHILSQAQVCPSVSAPAGQLCASLYVSPYARLVGTQGDQLIGEARSACEKGQDLCGESAAQLAEFLDVLHKDSLTSLASRSCP